MRPKTESNPAIFGGQTKNLPTGSLKIEAALVGILDFLHPELNQPRPRAPGVARPPANADVWVSAAPASKVRVLLVVDTDAENIGRNMQRNETNLRQALASGLGGDPQLELTVLSGARATPAAVRAYYRALAGRVGRDQTLYCYYCGHGGMRDGQHLLTMRHSGREEGLPRDELKRLVLACNPGLAVIITDCCANYMESMSAEDAQASVLLRPQRRATDGKSPLGDLLLHHRGVIDLSACAAGKVTWCDPFNGGHFTRAMIDCLEADGARGEFTTWGGYFGQLEAAALRFPKRVAPVSHTRLNP